MATPPGWFEYAPDPTRLRYWDGVQWTDHFVPKPPVVSASYPSVPARPSETPPIPKEQIAHDLAITYLNNRYGVVVKGSFSVDSTTDYETDAVSDVTGEGSVETEFLPDLDEIETVSVETGERHLFGLGPRKTRLEQTGRYEVDPHLRRMIADYHKAYARFLELLDGR